MRLNPCYVGFASRLYYYETFSSNAHCLNPCYVGFDSWLMVMVVEATKVGSLNPCYVGCTSWLQSILEQDCKKNVLILVMLDMPLGLCYQMDRT